MGLLRRDSGDDRSVHDVLVDVGHDIYHRVARRLDPDSADARLSWPHSEDCEYRGDGESNSGKGWW